MKEELKWAIMMGDTEEAQKLRKKNVLHVIERLHIQHDPDFLLGMANVLSHMRLAFEDTCRRGEPVHRYVTFFRDFRHKNLNLVGVVTFESLDELASWLARLVCINAGLICCIDADEGKFMTDPLPVHVSLSGALSWVAKLK